MANLHQIGWWLFNMAHPVAQMRGRPQYKNWGEDLIALGRAEELAPLTQLLNGIASDALTTMDPLNRFLKEQAQSVHPEVYWRASETAEAASKTSPHAAFLLSLVSMSGWASALGERLYQQYNGMPNPGWTRIPYTCALAAYEIGAIDGARQLVDESYDVLMAAKYQFDERLKAALKDYRQLAGKIQRKYDMAVANLADDLRESCRPGEHHFRAEVGAMMWTLGMIPESQLFQSTADPHIIPSRRLFRRIVQQSLDCMSHDSLVQYIWLELKDRPPFNIRDHENLFARINATYGQLMMLDELFPESPSEAYAKSLIAWFRGDITKEQSAKYLSLYELVDAMFPGIDWTIYIRMKSLAYLLARKFDLFADDVNKEKELESWYSLADMARSVRENVNKHPEWPEIHSKLNIALFHLIEEEFSQASDSTLADTKQLEKILTALEQYRASTLSYWLKVAPPIPSPEEQAALASLLEKEKELLTYLRGAYFLTLQPILPSHYHRYGMTLEEMIEQRSSPQSKKMFDPDVGRQQWKEFSDELKAIYTQMQAVSPGYARKRHEPKAELSDLINAISCHAA